MNGSDLIAKERARQISEEHYTASHDSGHGDELATAAACYALPESRRSYSGEAARLALWGWLWPWAERYWKPTPGDRIRELVKAGALIAAAIDAIEEAEPAAALSPERA